MLTSLIAKMTAPRTTAYAHCDLPCGVYDPAQARLEAESVKACMVKYHGSDDPEFKRWLSDTMFVMTYKGDVAPTPSAA